MSNHKIVLRKKFIVIDMQVPENGQGIIAIQDPLNEKVMEYNLKNYDIVCFNYELLEGVYRVRMVVNYFVDSVESV